jgi:hypothetical protein
MQYLDEPDATAVARFAACEREMGRTPPAATATAGAPPGRVGEG